MPSGCSAASSEEEVGGVGGDQRQLARADDAAPRPVRIGIALHRAAQEVEIVGRQSDVPVGRAGDDAAAVQGEPGNLGGHARIHAEQGHVDDAVGAGQPDRIGIGRAGQIRQTVDHQAVGLLHHDLGTVGHTFVPGQDRHASDRGLNLVGGRHR